MPAPTSTALEPDMVPMPSPEDVEAIISCIVQQVVAHVDRLYPRASDEARRATARLWTLRAAERLRPLGA